MTTQLSAILYAPNGLENVRRTIYHLQTQIGPRIELILVVPRGSHPGEVVFQPLTLQVLEVEPGISSALACSKAVRLASAPVIVFTEDHAFPEPGWAEMLTEAHEGDWYAVGPSVKNPNSQSLVSRADMLMNFLDQLQNPTGPSSTLMGHNTSYKKDVLASMTDDELVRMMRCEVLVHRQWGEQRCLHLAEACVQHVNVSKILPFLLHKIKGGVVFGGERCRGWPTWKRLVYILGAWAIPFLRIFKISRSLSALPTDQRSHYVACSGWLILALILHACGELLGYLGGPDLAEAFYQSYSQFEQRRWEMVRKADLTLRDVPI